MKDKWDQVTGYCCGTCRFFVPKSNLLGRCRRHAPTMAGFPVVYQEDDFCGDHKIGTNPIRAGKQALMEMQKEVNAIHDLRRGDTASKTSGDFVPPEYEPVAKEIVVKEAKEAKEIESGEEKT